jgi:hypothetical protein
MGLRMSFSFVKFTVFLFHSSFVLESLEHPWNLLEMDTKVMGAQGRD